MQRLLYALVAVSLTGCPAADDGDGGAVEAVDGAMVVDAGVGADAADESDAAPKNNEPEAVRGSTAAHNVVRARTQTQPALPNLVWDPTIAAFSQEWADELARRGCDLEHRPREGEFAQQYGENLFAGTGTYTPTEVVEAWASEEADYSYASNDCDPGKVCGHYTQLVWRNSARVGCAIADCERWTVWVCNYDPPGNFIGQKPY